ncbi:MAG TPA: hypothetical protein VK469_10860 [Candidatus Kapabacteria bacterium]|nr:hypothetical protein [Candidatus Kapabacteria bacterium]
MNNMTKRLLLIGGIVNAIFTLFHFYLHYQLYKLKSLPANLYALLLMLNLGGILIILFFTLAFLVYSREVLTTKLGGLALLFCSIFYGTRALEEIILSPRFSIVIFSSCIITSLLFLVIWIMRKRSSPNNSLLV